MHVHVRVYLQRRKQAILQALTCEELEIIVLKCSILENISKEQPSEMSIMRASIPNQHTDMS
eukprot:scaffold10034_cov18-Tisochrysis_lutea.AAC.1